MTVKHVRRSYAEQGPSTNPSGKVSAPPQPANMMKETPSRSATQPSPRSEQSDGSKKTWIAPFVIILILILCLFFFMRKGKSGTTAYFY